MLFTLEGGFRYLVDSVWNKRFVLGIPSMFSFCCCDGSGSASLDCIGQVIAIVVGALALACIHERMEYL